jgi:hypothetical protein
VQLGGDNDRETTEEVREAEALLKADEKLFVCLRLWEESIHPDSIPGIVPALVCSRFFRTKSASAQIKTICSLNETESIPVPHPRPNGHLEP